MSPQAELLNPHQQKYWEKLTLESFEPKAVLDHFDLFVQSALLDKRGSNKETVHEDMRKFIEQIESESKYYDESYTNKLKVLLAMGMIPTLIEPAHTQAHIDDMRVRKSAYYFHNLIHRNSNNSDEASYPTKKNEWLLSAKKSKIQAYIKNARATDVMSMPSLTVVSRSKTVFSILAKIESDTEPDFNKIIDKAVEVCLGSIKRLKKLDDHKEILEQSIEKLKELDSKITKKGLKSKSKVKKIKNRNKLRKLNESKSEVKEVKRILKSLKENGEENIQEKIKAKLIVNQGKIAKIEDKISGIYESLESYRSKLIEGDLSYKGISDLNTTTFISDSYASIEGVDLKKGCHEFLEKEKGFEEEDDSDQETANETDKLKALEKLRAVDKDELIDFNSEGEELLKKESKNYKSCVLDFVRGLDINKYNEIKRYLLAGNFKEVNRIMVGVYNEVSVDYIKDFLEKKKAYTKNNIPENPDDYFKNEREIPGFYTNFLEYVGMMAGMREENSDSSWYIKSMNDWSMQDMLMRGIKIQVIDEKSRSYEKQFRSSLSDLFYNSIYSKYSHHAYKDPDIKEFFDEMEARASLTSES